MTTLAEEALTVTCPVCNAGAGYPCLDMRHYPRDDRRVRTVGSNVRPHRDRIMKARQVLPRYLLVEVTGKLAEDVEAYLSQSVNGITAVWKHGPGCCCKNCPWKGDHE